jgi:O-antigen/teichoic acid export membrane protein
MLLLAIIAAGAAFFLGSWIIVTLYGAGYEPSVLILQILALSLIPALQNSVLIIFLYANGDEKFVNLLIGLGAVLNIGLCLFLIPGFGAAGTAWALLITESVLYWPYKLRSGGGNIK